MENLILKAIAGEHFLNNDADVFEGSIAIALDQDFNIIGAVSRKKRKILKCTLIKKVPPKLIGPDLETRPKGYDEYECAFGYVTTSHVLKQASSVAMADFKEKEKNPILQYPAVYFGLLFPEISDTLYYIPHVSEAGKTGINSFPFKDCAKS
ncbi:hypothetical protein K3495_g12915 [Podosphaera aphanis]|nr:hypothetical protein K3495_g12915 [Podosphaera aphanis]